MSIIDYRTEARTLARWAARFRQYPDLQQIRPRALRIFERRLTALSHRIREWKRTGEDVWLDPLAIAHEIEEIRYQVAAEDGWSRYEVDRDERGVFPEQEDTETEFIGFDDEGQL